MTEKLEDITFDSMLNETAVARKKSNLSNLAHAHHQLRIHVSRCQNLMEEIERVARNDSVLESSDASVVRDLYQRAQKLSEPL